MDWAMFDPDKVVRAVGIVKGTKKGKNEFEEAGRAHKILCTTEDLFLN